MSSSLGAFDSTKLGGFRSSFLGARGMPFLPGNLWSGVYDINTTTFKLLQFNCKKQAIVNEYEYPDGYRNHWGGTCDGKTVWICCSNTTINVYGNYQLIQFRAADGVVLNKLGTFCSYNPVYDGTYIWSTYSDDFLNNPGVPNINPSSVDGLVKIDSLTGEIAAYFPYKNAYFGFCAAFDGTDMWFADSETYNIVRMRIVDGTVVGNYPSGSGFVPLGMTFDGERMWWFSVASPVNSAFTGIWNININTGERAQLSGMTDGQTGFRSFVFDGEYLWIASCPTSNDSSWSLNKIDVNKSLVLATYPLYSGALGATIQEMVFDGRYLWVPLALSVIPGLTYTPIDSYIQFDTKTCSVVDSFNVPDSHSTVTWFNYDGLAASKTLWPQ